MSHYIYRQKKYVEIGDGRILPLCKYSDSSIWNGDNRSHPAWWCINTLGLSHLLVPKEEFKKAAKEEYDRQITLLKEFEEKYGDRYGKKEEINENSYHYGGNTYPGGGKLKNMRAFYSTRKTIPIDEFLRNCHSLSISLEALKNGSYDGYEKVNLPMQTEEDFKNAEIVYQNLLTKYPDCRDICIGVSGLY
jgi:hypothetical protein